MDRRLIGMLAGIAGFFALPATQALPTDSAYAPGTSHFTLDGGTTFGGDKVAWVKFTDGSTKYLYAGDTLFVDFGFLQNFSGTNWSLKGTVGYAFDSVNASNATFTFDRYPVDLLGIYNHGRSHFGVGLTYHMNGYLNMSGFGPNGHFDDATGYILQYQYWLFGIRYTNITYTAAAQDHCISNCSFDGSNFGVYFNYTF